MPLPTEPLNVHFFVLQYIFDVRYFYKMNFPKGEFPSGNFPIAHLGSCHLGKYPGKLPLGKKSFGRVPNVIFFPLLHKCWIKSRITIKELSFCHNLKVSKLNIFATLWCKPLLFQG